MNIDLFFNQLDDKLFSESPYCLSDWIKNNRYKFNQTDLHILNEWTKLHEDNNMKGFDFIINEIKEVNLYQSKVYKNKNRILKQNTPD